MPQPLSYQHPGYAFLNQCGSLQSEEDVFHYVDFLRQEAGLKDELPIDLTKIYQRFCIPEPMRVPLEEQQGILLNSYQGLILIKETDPIVRQRFTEGHELMELLFDAQADIQAELNLPEWDKDRKEQLCDAGAAELLMPRSSFTAKLDNLGVSLAAAGKLADLYQTSLLATLHRMLELTTEPAALILCRYALKPTEVRRDPSQAQEKLRIQRCKPNSHWQAGYIPRDKSIEPTSLIAQAYDTGVTQIGPETFQWGSKSISCHVEARPFKISGAPHVIALLKTKN